MYSLTYDEANLFLEENCIFYEDDAATYSYLWKGKQLACTLHDDDEELM